VKTGFVRILADAVKEKSKAGLANVNEGPEVPAKVKREEVWVARSEDGAEAAVWAVPEAGVREVLSNRDTNRHALKNAVTGEIVIDQLSKERKVDNLSKEGGGAAARVGGMRQDKIDQEHSVLRASANYTQVLPIVAKKEIKKFKGQTNEQNKLREELGAARKEDPPRADAVKMSRRPAATGVITGGSVCVALVQVSSATGETKETKDLPASALLQKAAPTEVNIAQTVSTTAAPGEGSPAKDERLDWTSVFTAGVFFVPVKV
jgi:hypothetical protein